MKYRDRLRAVLSPAERKIFSKLDSPIKIQNYLDKLPMNFEFDGETYMSPRRTLKAKTAHCFEGALLAAAAFAYHGQKPLLLDLKVLPADEDHVVALFRHNGRFGAISKTNHVILRYRDPVYRDPRELAMSYFHEYFLPDGRKTLRAFSKPFDLSRYAPDRWVTAPEDLFWLVEALDDSPHVPLVGPKDVRALRKAGTFETKAIAATEWPEKRRSRSRPS